MQLPIMLSGQLKERAIHGTLDDEATSAPPPTT